LVSVFLNIFSSFSLPREKLKKWLFWSGSLALLNSQGPPLMIASMINISELNYEVAIKYDSSVLSIVLLVMLSIAIALEIYVISENNGRYHL
jgi:hypothetical protein